MWRVKLFLFLFILPTARAHEPRTGQIHGLLGPFIYRTNFAGVNGFGETPFLGGAGMQVQGDIDPNGGIEIAVFYTQDLYKRDLGGLYIIEKTKRVRVSTGYRHWFSRQLGLGGLLYSAYSIGDPSVIHSDFQPVGAPDTSAGDVTEYGLDLSLQWEFWRSSVLAAVLDARYSYSLTDKDNEDGDQYGLFLALKFQVQQSSLRPETPGRSVK